MGRQKIVIKKNTGTVNINQTVKPRKRNGPDRDKLVEKLTKNQPLAKPAESHEIKKPDDLDLNNVVHHSNNCIANTVISAAWSQDAMIRFSRDRKFKRDAVLYRDTIRFNDWCFKLLGLQFGMQLALFTDKRDYPRYLIIQNVTTSYDAPAHLHRLGTFTLRAENRQTGGNRHLCRPETRTNLGIIGHSGFEKYPMALLKVFGHLADHEMPLRRLKGEPDILIGAFTDARKVPTDIVEKLIRIDVPLLESNVRPLNRIARSERDGRLEDLIPAG